MYCEPAWLWNVYGAGFQARVSAKNSTRHPRRSRITGCSAMSRPNPEPTNRTPARVSCRIVSSTAPGPPSQAWLLAVLTTSKPARASAAAAAGGGAGGGGGGNVPRRIGRRRRAGRNRALEIPERDVRRGERIAQREERV